MSLLVLYVPLDRSFIPIQFLLVVALNRFIKAIYEEYDYCKKVIKKHFNKHFVISVEDKRRF